jgi:hypothetical protein
VADAWGWHGDREMADAWGWHEDREMADAWGWHGDREMAEAMLTVSVGEVGKSGA